MKNKEFNVSQGTPLLLLKPLNLLANYALNLIIYITNLSNNIWILIAFPNWFGSPPTLSD